MAGLLATDPAPIRVPTEDYYGMTFATCLSSQRHLHSAVDLVYTSRISPPQDALDDNSPAPRTPSPLLRAATQLYTCRQQGSSSTSRSNCSIRSMLKLLLKFVLLATRICAAAYLHINNFSL